MNGLDGGSPLAAYYGRIRPRIGETTRRRLGPLDAVTIGRYAMTIGATDPIHHDEDAARAAGHPGVVAPPNMLAAVLEWGVGTPESGLNRDGTPAVGENAVGGTDLDLRAMGAGEEMELVNPAVAGMDLVLDTTIVGADLKATRGGPCVFVTTALTLAATDGTVLNRNRRTVVLRDAHQETR